MLTHASIIFGDMLASVNSVNSLDMLRGGLIIRQFFRYLITVMLTFSQKEKTHPPVCSGADILTQTVMLILTHILLKLLILTVIVKRQKLLFIA